MSDSMSKNEIDDIRTFIVDAEARVEASGGLPQDFVEMVHELSEKAKNFDTKDSGKSREKQILEIQAMAKKLWNYSDASTHITDSMKDHVHRIYNRTCSLEIH